MPGPHRAPYPPEFRAEAVRLVQAADVRIAQVARDLGVNAETLRLWVRQADVDAGRHDGLTTASRRPHDGLTTASRRPHDGLTTAERTELARLRRENRILKEEREILRKAAAFFAKETTR